jgi:MoxR-like ATPase
VTAGVVHTRGVAPDSPILIDAERARELVAAKRADAGPGLVDARRAAEDEACALLDRTAGNMSAEDAAELLRLFNVDAYRGEPRRWRFVPGFSGGVAKQLLGNLGRLNDAVRGLWSGSIEDALDELDAIMKRRDLPGAGRSFPSMLLYLRDRDRYAVLGNAIANGLRALTGENFSSANGRDAYVEFCAIAARVREELRLAPQELDWILAAASRPRPNESSIDDIRIAWDRRAEWRKTEEWEEPRLRALPDVQSTVGDFMAGRDDVQAFRHRIDNLSRTAPHWGFRGTGQMFFNMLVRTAEPEVLTNALKLALAPPSDDDDCRHKFEEFSRFVAETKVRAEARGAAPAQLGYAPFFLSFFWEAAAREDWPVYYPVSREALTAREMLDDSGSLAERYLRFRDVMAELRDRLGTDQWGVESVLFHLGKRVRGRPPPPQPPPGQPSIYTSYLDHNLIFPDDVITSVVLSLLAKPFLILTGISGTGKTRIATGLAQYLEDGSSEARHQLIAVRSDWTDPRGLIGYENPITERYASTPFLDLLLRAQADPESVYVAILDEMNLARVEYYFSDFLSALESGVPIPLRAGTQGDDGVPSSVSIGPNVLFIGTVNVDETTHAFSPKVLDRANVIEFNDVALDRYFEREAESLPSAFRLREAGVGPGAFLAAADHQVDLAELPTSVTEALTEVHSLLERDRLHFGYRVISEIMRYVSLALDMVDGDQDEVARTAFDLQLLQKVLPKLTGGRELEPALGRLLAYCVDGTQPAGDDVAGALERYDASGAPRYPRAAAKLARMLSRLGSTGFVSALD